MASVRLNLGASAYARVKDIADRRKITVARVVGNALAIYELVTQELDADPGAELSITKDEEVKMHIEVQ